MATVTSLPNGKKLVQFDDHHGIRRGIRVGKLTREQAREIGQRCERLARAKRAGVMLDGQTAEWLAGISDELVARLAALELCQPRQAPEPAPVAAVPTLGEFLGEYIRLRSDLKPGTRGHLERTRDALLEFFGAGRELSKITPLDADAFRLHLGKTRGENTVRRMASRARQFFAAAVRGKRIPENPFSHLKGLAVRSVKARQAFITREQMAKLLEAAPTAEWRAIIALARYAGLRVPSELLGLRWADVDFVVGRMTVTSPKTAHCGKGSRIVPLFPELRPWLQEAFDAALAADGGLPEFVVTRYRRADQNLRTTFLKIIARAGLKAWPKLFVNLRASRATELVEHFPGHVAAEWLGHTEAVANEHYRQVTADHYARALQQATGCCTHPLQKFQESASKAPHAETEICVFSGENANSPFGDGVSGYPARIRT